MIPKKKEDYMFVEGSGRPYEVTPRNFEPVTNQERQKPVVINLSELNGQDGADRVPKNFHPKRGRTLGSFCYPEKGDRDVEEAFDIE
jgi:hypothetical protein